MFSQKFCRKEGIKICVYIDDGFGAAFPPFHQPPPSTDLALEEAEFVKNSLN